MKTLPNYSTELTNTFTKVLESLGLNPEDGELKESFFQPELAAIQFGSVFEDGRFRLNTNDNTVERTKAEFDETESKVIITTIFSVINNEDFTFVTTNPEKLEEILSIAPKFDHYVGARELDYREGVRANERVLENLKELGVTNVTYKNVIPMFSSTPRDFSFNL